MGEDGSERCHHAHVAVAFHAHHIDGFAQGTVHVAVLAVCVGRVGGILTVVDFYAAWVVVILVVVGAHPRVASVVVLINDFHRIVVAPRGVVSAPGFHIAYRDYVGILLLDGFVEHVVALGVVLALRVCVGLIVLVAYFDELQVVRFGMSVGHALGSPYGRCVAVGILYSVKGILHQGFGFFKSEGIAVTQAHVHHEKWCCAEVFAHLEIFVKAQSVARPVAPVAVRVSRTLLNRADSLLPLECIVV